MPSNKICFDSSSDSEVSEILDYELEVEGSSNASDQSSDTDEAGEAYADEPIADEEWLAIDEEEKSKNEELEEKLQKCLNGTEEVREW